MVFKEIALSGSNRKNDNKSQKNFQKFNKSR